MATTIDPAAAGAPRWPTGEQLAASMQAMASSAGAQLDLAEVMRLYTESGAAPAGSSGPVTGATRPGVPPISPPTFSADDAALMIGQLQSKLLDLMAQQQTGEVKSNQVDMKKKNAEQLEKVQKWLSDLAEAQAQKKSAGIWGWIKSVFTAVASVVAAVLAVAASPFTGGASLIVAAIAIGAAIQACGGLLLKALEEAGVNVPQGLKDAINYGFSIGGWVAGIARLCGASESTAAWIQMGVDLVVGIATGVAAWRAISSAGAKLAAGAEEVAEMATRAMGQSASKLSMGAQRGAVAFDAGQNVVSAGAGVAEGVYTIKAANAQQSADEAMADKMAIMAQINRLQMLMEQNIEDLKKIADEMQSVFRIVGDLISGEADMKSQINAHMGGRSAV